MLAFIQPESMHPPIIRSVQDFHPPRTIQVGHSRVRLVVFNHIIIFGQWCSGVHWQGLPIESISIETTTVRVKDVYALIFTWRMTHTAIVHITGCHYLHRAIPVHVSNHARSMCKVGAVAFLAYPIALTPTTQLGRQAFPHAHFTPAFASIHDV